MTLRHAISSALQVKAFEATKANLTSPLTQFFVDQLNSIADELLQSYVVSVDVDAAQAKLEDAASPVLAYAMSGVAKTELRKGSKSTASDWLEENPNDWQQLIQAVQAAGLPISVMTEMPIAMQTRIMELLQESFSQPYWKAVHQVTAGDAGKYLQEGLSEGWSIRQSAGNMRQHFDPNDPKGTFRYARRRSEAISRTETGSALNGSRRTSMDQLAEDLASDGITMRMKWLSVMGNTIRDSHAAMNGQSIGVGEKFNLAGYDCRWPSDITLPPNQRINCQCSLSSEFS